MSSEFSGNNLLILGLQFDVGPDRYFGQCFFLPDCISFCVPGSTRNSKTFSHNPNRIGETEIFFNLFL